MEIELPSKIKEFATNPKRINVLEGGRGGSKSWSVADLFLLWGLEKKQRFLCTREIQKSISESVYQLLKDKIIEKKYPYEILKTVIRCPLTGSEFYFSGLQDRTSQNLKSFEGADWCWVEEAQSISKESLDILVPTIRKDNSKLVFTMNRFEEQDPVISAFCTGKRDDVLHITINYTDNPFCPDVLKREAEECKKLSIDDYNHIWLGYPIQQGDNKILKLSKVKAAMERKVDGVGSLDIGVDVARFGDDRTIITPRKGFKTYGQVMYQKLRTFEVVDRAIEQEIAGNSEIVYKVDDTGVGGGVTDGLFQRGKNVVPINNGQKAKNPDKYPNAISEMWFEFADIIDQIELPNDQELLKELCGREYTFDKQGRRCVESKDDFKKRYGRSPDKADSLLLAYYAMYSGGSFFA
jgi:phage terminase large subunit